MQPSPFRLRLATVADIPDLEILIPLSVRGLQARYYSASQMEAAIGPAFGVDRQLIEDGTYFVVESDSGQIIACGGWSHRKTMYGGDRHRSGQDDLIDPAHDPARVRAFFVHPDWARQGIGRMLLHASETAIRAAGFHRIAMVATLAGEPLYAAHGYRVEERYEAPLPDGQTLPVVKMVKDISPAA